MTIDKTVNTPVELKQEVNKEIHFDKTFFSQDKNTAKLEFNIVEDGMPVVLAGTSMTATIAIKTYDGSLFTDAAVIDVENAGLIYYILTDEQLKREGKAQGELYINDGTKRIAAIRFSFRIKLSLVDEVGIKEPLIIDTIDSAVERLINANPEQFKGKDAVITENSIKPEMTTFIESSKNLFDKRKAVYGVLDARGVVTSSTSYYLTAKYFVKSGQSITINKFRNYLVTDINGGIITYNGTATTNHTYTATQDCYIQYTIYATDLEVVQVEYGSVATSYAPHYQRLSSDIQLGQVSIDASTNYVLNKSGEQFNAKTLLNNKELEIRTVRNGSKNDSFNFDRDLYDGTLIHATGDDITPVRTWTTIGANHGYTNIVDLPNNGKTTADLGSVWTDGTTQYVLLRIVNNRLWLACPYIVETDGRITSKLVAPITDLTHVSGATNTTTINKLGYISTTQLYPSTGKISVKYIADGTEVKQDGDYKCREWQVVENYTVLDIKAIIDWSKANIGKDYATARDSIGGVLVMSNTFNYYGRGLCTTSHSIRFLQKVLMGQSGVLQSVALEHPTYKVWRYVPNTMQIGTVDFTQPVDLATYNTTNFVTKDKLIDPTIPTNRYIDYIKNGNETVLAFSLGHITDKTNSKHADRLTNISSTIWDFRNTKKSYPSVIHNKVYEAGTYLTFEGYRNYFVPKNDVLNTNVIEDKASKYIYIDDMTARTFNSVQFPEYLGAKVTVVESKDFTLLADTIDSNGLNYALANPKGYAILKVS